MPAYGYTVINRCSLCNCQLQGGNEVLHESLVPCPSADMKAIDINMYFTINLAFAYQLQLNFPEAITPEDFISQLTTLSLVFQWHYRIKLILQVTWIV